MPIAPGGAQAIYDPSQSHSVLGCSGHSSPVGPLLFQLCFSVSPPTVTRPTSLPLPLRVPGQGLACGAGCWLSEGVSDTAPLPPQYLLGHWFLSCSLPQIFRSSVIGIGWKASVTQWLQCPPQVLEATDQTPTESYYSDLKLCAQEAILCQKHGNCFARCQYTVTV